MATKRIIIIINKTWEASAILGAFRSPYNGKVSAKPLEWAPGKPYPTLQDHNSAGSSYHFCLAFGTTLVELWCLADFADTSDSGVKCGIVPKIISAGSIPDLIIAAGTAASQDSKRNGNVVVGGRTFIHDPGFNPVPPAPNWPTETAGLMDHILESGFEWSRLAAGATKDIVLRFILPQANAGCPQVIIDKDQVSVGDVNVTDPSQYPEGDARALAACRKADPQVKIGSIDTTLALVRALVRNIPFIFVSGISNQLGQFASEVQPFPFSQNCAASQNIGVTLAWLLPLLV